ncbi:MAG: Druantia anti-phage system protein DruA [Sedimentisphaerales bacterium]
MAELKKKIVGKAKLRNKILAALKNYGFKINPHLRPAGYSKNTLRRMQRKAKIEQIALHSNFLRQHFNLVRSYNRDGKDIIPEQIELELREVQPESFEEIIFRWWNFVWWSIPYQHPYGRQLRFLLWDKKHDCPFGLISLQSPILKMSVRDKALNLPNSELDLWVNKSMHAQRVGALPPYNELLGGKMVALALTANEVREAYKNRYANYISIIKKQTLKPELLFITTTSAFGKSSLYNRLKYNGEIVADCLGYTQGTGSFHIPEKLYEELLIFLEREGIDIARGYGNGPSRKLRLLSLGLSRLGLPSFECHGIKREFYLFPLAKNLRNVIHNGKRAISFNRPFEALLTYWKKRWALPRADRMPDWNNFSSTKFFKKAKRTINEASKYHGQKS